MNQDEIGRLISEFNWNAIILSLQSDDTNRQRGSVRSIAKHIEEAERREKGKKRASLRLWKKNKKEEPFRYETK